MVLYNTSSCLPGQHSIDTAASFALGFRCLPVSIIPAMLHTTHSPVTDTIHCVWWGIMKAYWAKPCLQTFYGKNAVASRHMPPAPHPTWYLFLKTGTQKWRRIMFLCKQYLRYVVIQWINTRLLKFVYLLRTWKQKNVCSFAIEPKGCCELWVLVYWGEESSASLTGN